MMSTSNRFATEEQAGLNYHAVSGWAVAALVVGLLSSAAMIGPLLWFVPAAGICLAIFAMRLVSKSAGELTGWNIALVGLIFSVLFGIAGPVHTMSRHFWLETRAALFAEGFIDLLQQNQPYVAQQFTLHPSSRRLAAADLPGVIEKDEKAQKAFNEFLKREPVKSLLEHGKSAKIERLSSQVLSEDTRDDVAVRYRITFPGDTGAAKALDVSLVAERSLGYPSKEEQWQIVQMGELDK